MCNFIVLEECSSSRKKLQQNRFLIYIETIYLVVMLHFCCFALKTERTYRMFFVCVNGGLVLLAGWQSAPQAWRGRGIRVRVEVGEGVGVGVGVGVCGSPTWPTRSLLSLVTQASSWTASCLPDIYLIRASQMSGSPKFRNSPPTCKSRSYLSFLLFLVITAAARLVDRILRRQELLLFLRAVNENGESEAI